MEVRPTREAHVDTNAGLLGDDSDATRKRLREGTVLAAWRADPPAGMTIRSDEELEASLADMLRTHDKTQDVYVFGYGSLMWNPALEHAGVWTARLQGWHRRFCLRLLFARGSPDDPGVMCALDRGGACIGRVYRIPAAMVAEELRLLWRREMLAGSYTSRWVTVLAEGRRLRALTFVANRHHDRYLGGLPVEQIAHLVRTGKGGLGTSRAYFETMLATLEGLAIRDAGMERLRRALSQADGPPPRLNAA
ncbi:gamma-glutamylcyclotransferase [Variovorax sp. GT1P44]|uniref:gamma-glutamylcyclotransferase n=1 Tax=Variovorax sp. GT1P44 TaxID=3443742 RepID=UPI003F46013C